MTVSTQAFIRRYPLHVPVPGTRVGRAYGVYAPPQACDLAIGRARVGQRPVEAPAGWPGRRRAKAAVALIPNVVRCVVVGSWPSASSSPASPPPLQRGLGRRSHEPCVRGGPSRSGRGLSFLPTGGPETGAARANALLRRPRGDTPRVVPVRFPMGREVCGQPGLVVNSIARECATQNRVRRSAFLCRRHATKTLLRPTGDRYLNEAPSINLRGADRSLEIRLVTTRGNHHYGITNVVHVSRLAGLEFAVFKLLECAPQDLHDLNLLIDDHNLLSGDKHKGRRQHPTNFAPSDSTAAGHAILDSIVSKESWSPESRPVQHPLHPTAGREARCGVERLGGPAAVSFSLSRLRRLNRARDGPLSRRRSAAAPRACPARGSAHLAPC